MSLVPLPIRKSNAPMIALACLTTGGIAGLYLYSKHKLNSSVSSMWSIAPTPPYFLIERILIANMAALDGKNVVIGVTGRHNDPHNILSHQGIRIGDGSIQKLLSVSKTQNGLIYEFEENTKLVFMKNDSRIVYSLQTLDRSIMGLMDPLLLSKYKTIDMNSEELDMIQQLK